MHNCVYFFSSQVYFVYFCYFYYSITLLKQIISVSNVHFNRPNTMVAAKTLLFLFIALIIYDPVHFRDYWILWHGVYPYLLFLFCCHAGTEYNSVQRNVCTPYFCCHFFSAGIARTYTLDRQYGVLWSSYLGSLLIRKIVILLFCCSFSSIQNVPFLSN